MTYGGDEVLVWWMSVASPATDAVGRWHATLDAAERARAERFRFAADRAAYIAAHALTRALLSEAAGLPPEEWSFVLGAAGKPAVDPALGIDLRFSLSHTRGLVAAAVCARHELGVDVEGHDRVREVLGIADRFFAPAEIVALRALTDDDTRADAFLRIWTLKEAYLKATARGLGDGLGGFSVTLDPIGIAEHADEWQLLQLCPTPRHVLAVALHRHVDEPVTFVSRSLLPDELG